MWSTKRDIHGVARTEELYPPITVCWCFSEYDDVGFAKTVSENLAHELGGISKVKHFLQHDSDEDNLVYVILESHQRSMLKICHVR